MKDATFFIKLDLTMMGEKLQCAIGHRSEEINGLITQTVQAYCEDGSIERLVDVEVRKALDVAVKDSIDRYFRLGNGRSHIEKRVEAALDEVIK